MSHYVIKIASGEVIYGTVENELEKKMLVVNNPLVWEDYESEDGRVGSALVNYLVGTTEKSIPIAVSSIISMASMSDAFTNFYEVAVKVQEITDEAYKEKLVHMTRKMMGLVMEYQDKAKASSSGGLVISADSDSTIH
jgi:hypothetical protein